MRGLPDSFDRGFFPHAPRIEALAHRLHAQALQGHFSAAALTRAELERHLASGRHPLSESQGLWCLAYVHQQRGECESAAVLCERALARMSGHDANPGKPLHLALLACTCASLGALERGETLAREAIQRHSEQRTRMAQVVIHKLAGAALLRAGELREARELIDAALRLSADPGNCFGLADALGLLGELQWREARDGPLAESTLRRAIGVAREQRAVLLEVHACDRLAALWDALDRTADACALMREVLARLDAQADAPQLGAVRERQAVRYSASAT